MATKHKEVGTLYFIFGIVIFFILFYFSSPVYVSSVYASPVYASCENEYIPANGLVNVFRGYRPHGLIEVKLKPDRNNLRGFTLLEHLNVGLVLAKLTI